MKRNQNRAVQALLSDYYSFEGNTATINLFYDSFEDLVNQNFGTDDVNLLNDRLFDDTAQAMDLLLNKYNVKIRLNIRDYGKFSTKQAKDILESNLMLKFYSVLLNQYRNRRHNICMVASGAALLVASYFCSSINLPGLVFDIVNISGTLMIWEALCAAFITEKDERRKRDQNIRRIKEFWLCNPDDSTQDILVNMRDDTREKARQYVKDRRNGK